SASVMERLTKNDVYAAAGKDEDGLTIEPPKRWQTIQHYMSVLGNRPEFQALLSAVETQWDTKAFGFGIHEVVGDNDEERQQYPSLAHVALWGIFESYDRVTRNGAFNPLTLAIQTAAQKEFGLTHVPDTGTPEQHAEAERLYGAVEP